MKAAFFVLAALASTFACADLDYTVKVAPDPANLHVTLRIPDTGSGAKLQIPNWAPGSYRLTDAYKNVKNLSAKDGAGRVLKIDQSIEKLKKEYGDPGANGDGRRTAENDLCTWSVEPAQVTVVEYDIASNLIDGAMHWSGPSTYIYPVGRTQEKCTLKLELPTGWKGYLGLDERQGEAETYDAATYDVLADNPVTTGEVTVDLYFSRHVPHTIVMRGRARANVDRAYLVKACKHVSDAQTDLFGGAPYSKYVWHFSVNDAADGAGGLEHLSSTQIGLAAGVGPRAVGVLSHEFFHLWNVKRIRSRVLGPFDYTKLPDTGALWWLEGVTDYYAHQLLYRYSWTDRRAFFDTAVRNLGAVATNPAYKEVGPHESSLRVAEASNGRGNSNGWRISYYNLGWLAGMVLDIEMRDRTSGRRTLDDVLLALWDQNRDDKPGFGEDEIRRQLVRFGGQGMGTVYDTVIMGPGPMPIDATLAKAGLRMIEKDEAFADLGFSTGAPNPEGARVNRVSGPAEGKLKVDDVVVAVGGTPISGTRGSVNAGITRMNAEAKVGEPTKLKVQRGTETLDIEIVPVAGTRKARLIEPDPNASPAARAIGEGWLAQKSL